MRDKWAEDDVRKGIRKNESKLNHIERNRCIQVFFFNIGLRVDRKKLSLQRTKNEGKRGSNKWKEALISRSRSEENI